MLVTSLRDGMNLVAKEFVSTREDEDGVLVLSELTGAAGELREALSVNPYSLEELMTAMTRALEMDREERRERMSALRLRIKGHTVHNWVDRFTSAVDAAATGCLNRPAAAARTVRASIERGTEVSLVLPFEGVLVEDAEDASRSGPDPELLQLLRDLTMRAGVTVHVLSGLDHQPMDRWFDLRSGGDLGRARIVAPRGRGAPLAPDPMDDQRMARGRRAAAGAVRRRHARRVRREAAERARLALPPCRSHARPEPGARPSRRCCVMPRSHWATR